MQWHDGESTRTVPVPDHPRASGGNSPLDHSAVRARSFALRDPVSEDGPGWGHDRGAVLLWMSWSGVELTDEVTELMAVEAEAGLDVTKLRRRPGRPRMGSAPAEGGSRLP